MTVLARSTPSVSRSLRNILPRPSILASSSSLSCSSSISIRSVSSLISRSSSLSSSLSSTSLPCSSPSSSSSSLLRRPFSIETAKVPQLGDSITEGTIVKWMKSVGEFTEMDEVLVVIETDKVSVDIRAPSAGKIVKRMADEGQTIKVGDSLAEIDTNQKGTKGAEKEKEKPKEKEKEKKEDRSHVHSAQPSQTARGSEVIEGSTQPAPKSLGGLERAPASTSAAPAPAKPSPSTAPAAFSSPLSRGVRRVPMSRMRQTIANRLKAAQNTAAMLTTFNEIDMSAAMELRGKYKDEFLERTGSKLGFMSLFVKSSVAALQKFPDVNASIDGQELIYRDFCDISVAVSTPTGLVVPVLRNVESQSFSGIESAIAVLGAKARKGQIAIEDMVGGGFTISNGGVYGSLFGTPIINPPQSAILGMHGIHKRPVAVGDKIEIRPMMYVALTYDHRIIDGGTAVQFLKEIKLNVEDPARLLLQM